MISLPESLKICTLQKAFNISARAPRSEYWWFFVCFFIYLFSFKYYIERYSGFIGWVLIFFLGYLSICLLTATARRLHDINRSILWTILPVVTVLAYLYALLDWYIGGTIIVLSYWIQIGSDLLLLLMLILKGTKGDNRFGKDPLSREVEVNIDTKTNLETESLGEQVNNTSLEKTLNVDETIVTSRDSKLNHISEQKITKQIDVVTQDISHNNRSNDLTVKQSTKKSFFKFCALSLVTITVLLVSFYSPDRTSHSSITKIIDFFFTRYESFDQKLKAGYRLIDYYEVKKCNILRIKLDIIDIAYANASNYHSYDHELKQASIKNQNRSKYYDSLLQSYKDFTKEQYKEYCKYTKFNPNDLIRAKLEDDFNADTYKAILKDYEMHVSQEIDKVPKIILDKDVIADVQYILNQLGYYKGSFNGVFNLETSKAIYQFQKEQRLPNANGFVHKHLLYRLKACERFPVPCYIRELK